MTERPACSLVPLEPRRHFAVDLAANLAVGSFDPRTGAIDCAADVINVGDATPTGQYKIRWFLSRDQVVNNGDDIVLLEATLGAGPAPNHSIERLDKPIVGYTVPDGAYYVGFAVDVNNVIAEDSDANNLIFTNNPTLAVNSEPILIQGTDRDDTITLSPGADVAGRPQIVARMNNLTVARSNVFRAHPIQIRGGGGNDSIDIDPTITAAAWVDGGAGRDLIHGGGGNDSLYGGSDNDVIYGGPGNDRISGNGGGDRIFGEGGRDRLYGNGGSDRLDGGGSNDRLDGGAGGDVMIGGSGNDVFQARDGFVDNINGSSGDDSARIDEAFDITTSITTLLE